MKTKRGSDVKGWVEPLLGFVLLGMGQVVIGLLEGLLVGPDELPIRKRIRAVLKRLKVSKVGPSLVPTSTGRASGFRRVKLGLKGNGLGWPFKPKKAAVSGPTKLAYEVHLPSSSQRPHAEELKLAFKVRLGASGDKISVLERGVGESPPLSTLPMCNDCVGVSALKSDGSGAGVEVFVFSPVMENSQAKVAGEGFRASDRAVGVVSLPVIGPTLPVTGSSSSVTSEVGVVPSSDFGLPVVNIAQISSTTLITSATSAIILLISKRVEVAALVSGSPAVSVIGLESLGIGDLGESSV